MTVYGLQIITEEHILVLDELEYVLKKLLNFVRQGDYASDEFDTLISRVDSLVQRATLQGIKYPAELGSRCSTLQRLFESLCLVLAVEKNDVSEGLTRIRKGKKMISVYSINT